MKPSPAFLFYHQDFFSDPNVLVMTKTEQRDYIFLLGVQWDCGSIPGDLESLARITGCTMTEFGRAWARIGKCFNEGEVPGTLQNERMRLLREQYLRLQQRRSEGGRKSAQQRTDGNSLGKTLTKTVGKSAPRSLGSTVPNSVGNTAPKTPPKTLGKSPPNTAPPSPFPSSFPSSSSCEDSYANGLEESAEKITNLPPAGGPAWALQQGPAGRRGDNGSSCDEKSPSAAAETHHPTPSERAEIARYGRVLSDDERSLNEQFSRLRRDKGNGSPTRLRPLPSGGFAYGGERTA